jgi:hypothetical protein
MNDVEKVLNAIIEELDWEACTTLSADTANAVWAVQRSVERALASLKGEGKD